MRARRPLLGFALDIGFALALALAALIIVAAAVSLAADPSAAPAEVLEAGDLRSEGQGPGLVGSPLLILAGVIALGLATALVTALVVRFTRRD